VKPDYELAQVIERFGKEFVLQHDPNAYIRRTLSAIFRCRTSAMGGHVDKCERCGHLRISYNSCRNRHCPKCQNTRREAWIESRKADLIPVPYFHVVFTVPEKLNALFLQHKKLFYNLLFSAAWETINQFSYTKLQAETGMVAVLHTWGQNLSFHPHVHCIIPGGGIDYKFRCKQVSISENGKVFLFPVKNLSMVFRRKFILALIIQLPQERRFIRKLYQTPWIVYTKDPFAATDQVVEYLGRYTHKVAITNHRLLNIDHSGVRFRYRDYRDNRQKEMTLGGTEFLRRFFQHILPKGFVRIRHFGLLATSKLEQLRKLQLAFGIIVSIPEKKKDWKVICRHHLGFNPDICPFCYMGIMVTIERFLPARDPPVFQQLIRQNVHEHSSRP
jgi:hypothetical protein